MDQEKDYEEPWEILKRENSEKAASDGEEPIYIEVSVFTYIKSTFLVIYYNSGKATLGGCDFELDIPAFTSKLFTIVSSWQPKMMNYGIIDGMKYGVHIEKGGEVYDYEGRNSFPDNFRDFSKLLRDYGVRK